jgi:hypothetical protein
MVASSASNGDSNREPGMKIQISRISGWKGILIV